MASSLEKDIGQLLVGGFEGQMVDELFAELARAGRVGGAVLFRRNLGTLEDVRALTQHLHGLHPSCPLWVALDQEGGRVQRLRSPFPELPPMRVLGSCDRSEVAELAGRVLGESLRTLGFDQNYAPVVDVDTHPGNPVIGDRSFSGDPEVVGRLATAFLQGMQAAGIAGCAKHFPGHGDTDSDSHLTLPTCHHDLERLRATELPPFFETVRGGVDAVMTAHVVYTELDPDRPATLSERVLGLLRDELGFNGVIVSDDLEMAAIAAHREIESATVEAIAAGCDQVLICRRPERLARAFDALRDAVSDGRLDVEAVRIKAARVRALKARYARPLGPLEPSPVVFPDALYERLQDALKDAGALVPETPGRDPTEGAPSA